MDPLNSDYKELVISSDVLTPVKNSQYIVNKICVEQMIFCYNGEIWQQKIYSYPRKGIFCILAAIGLCGL